MKLINLRLCNISFFSPPLCHPYEGRFSSRQIKIYQQFSFFFFFFSIFLLTRYKNEFMESILSSSNIRRLFSNNLMALLLSFPTSQSSKGNFSTSQPQLSPQSGYKNLGTLNTRTNISVNDPRFRFRAFSVLITIISTKKVRKPEQLSLVYGKSRSNREKSK